MSIEQALADLTAAVKENTAALKAGGGAATSTTSTTDKATKGGKTKETPAATGYTAKHTKDEMIAALTDLKEKKGLPEAKKIIKDVGGKDKMQEIEGAETIDKVYDAAKKALGGSDDDSGDDGL